MHIKRIQSVTTNSNENNIIDITKRNKLLELVIAPIDNISLDSIDSSLSQLFNTIKVIKIAKYSPENRTEFEIWGKYWPITYHPNESDRIRTNEKNMNDKSILEFNKICYNYIHTTIESDIQHISTILNHTSNINRMKLGGGGAIIVNPVNNRIVMTCGNAIRSCFLNPNSSTYRSFNDKYKKDKKNDDNINSNINSNSNIDGNSNSNIDGNMIKSRLETHPLFQSAVIYCIEGVAALIRGEIVEEHTGKNSKIVVLLFIYLYIPIYTYIYTYIYMYLYTPTFHIYTYTYIHIFTYTLI